MNAGGWAEFRLTGPLAALEVFADFMDELGAGGAVFSEDPVQGDMVTVFLPGPAVDDEMIARVRARAEGLKEEFSGAWRTMEVTRIEDRDWAAEWKANLEPIRLEPGLWIVPTFKPAPPQAAGEPQLLLDPGMAFGTGRHATTTMALEFLAREVRAGRASVLDLGAGTGILAMAAARFGATRILGVEIDPLALKAAAENLKLNGLEGRVRLMQGVSDPNETLPEPPFDLIVANIFAEALAKLLPFMDRRLAPGGRMVFAGILEDRLPALAEAMSARGFAVIEQKQEGEWVTLLIGRASAK